MVPVSCEPINELDCALYSFVQNYAHFRNISIFEARLALEGQPAYSHLVLPTNRVSTFIIVYVGFDRSLKQDTIEVIDVKQAHVANGMPHHVGSLEKVICDLMWDEMNCFDVP